MGIVYKAEDIKLQRPVALKFLPHQWVPDPDARERFTQEARAASALDHPNICTIHEIEETDDGRLYIAMGCYEGESLREKIKRGPLGTDKAIDLAIQAASGMAKAHAKGIVHRDLKPANILVTEDGVAKVVDFGLAKLAGQVKLTREGTTVGTVAYMSPEQAKGEAVDQRTDIWSLGVVLYEMLSGVLPFKGDHEQSLIHSILQHEPERLTKFRKACPRASRTSSSRPCRKNPPPAIRRWRRRTGRLKAIADGLRPARRGLALPSRPGPGPEEDLRLPGVGRPGHRGHPRGALRLPETRCPARKVHRRASLINNSPDEENTYFINGVIGGDPGQPPEDQGAQGHLPHIGRTISGKEEVRPRDRRRAGRELHRGGQRAEIRQSLSPEGPADHGRA